MREPDAEEIKGEILAAEANLLELEERAFHLWERVRVTPILWSQKQYIGIKGFWVIGVLGNQCLYLNSVEGGWGWGRYIHWGKINEYHWEQLEINHVVLQTLFAIDNGGKG